MKYELYILKLNLKLKTQISKMSETISDFLITELQYKPVKYREIINIFKNVSFNHCIGGWMGPRDGLDDLRSENY
jgi:hypothetical protein